MAKRPDLRALISLLAVLALVLALVLGAGCTSDDDESADTDSEAATEEEAVEDEAVEDEAETDDAGTADEGMSEGEQLVQERCTACHDLTRVEAADYDKAGWEANVDRMIQNGASLTPEERDVVVDYLAAGN